MPSPFSPEYRPRIASVILPRFQRFRRSIDRAPQQRRGFLPHQVTVVPSTGAMLRSSARDVAEIVQRHGYSVNLLHGSFQDRGLDDIRLLESLWQSELCIFLLSERISDAHVALAMAHAHCIPSIRLQHDKRSTDCAPSVSGLIRWRNSADMLIELERQLNSYQGGLVRPIELARASSATDAARRIGTMRWTPRNENCGTFAAEPPLSSTSTPTLA